MKTSSNGIKLIKEFEGCDLKATKAVPTEKYYTIGYGHYGSDVKKGQTITKEEAELLLISDLSYYEKKVSKYNNIYNFNQNEFDALVSFCYNIGNIDQLTSNGKRSRNEIKSAIIKYNKRGGIVYKGLTNRRKKELELFNKPCASVSYFPACKSNYKSIIDALKSINVNSSYGNRKHIAYINGISNYKGTPNQNSTLLILLKQGKLKCV